MTDAAIERLALIADELEGLPHVTETCREAVAAYRSQAERVKALEGALTCLDGDREIKPLDGDRLERLLDFEERWACVCPSSDASLSWPDQRALLNEAVLAFRSREALAALNPTGEPT